MLQKLPVQAFVCYRRVWVVPLAQAKLKVTFMGSCYLYLNWNGLPDFVESERCHKFIPKCIFYKKWPVVRAVTRPSTQREVWDSNLGQIKSDTVLTTARHRCDISSKGAVLLGRNDAEMGPANSLHVSARYSEYNERFYIFHKTFT